MNNLILMTDSYKISHWKQYPIGTTHVYSYFESRGGQYENTLFFGLQYYLKKYLVSIITNYDEVAEARDFFKGHFGSDIFNYWGWTHIIKEHNGRLPVEIKAVPEGTLVPMSNVLFTVENTCPECFWVTSYLETLLEKVWYPTTIATKSYYQKQVIKKYLSMSGSDIPDFKLHDFGYRGSTSEESAGLGGMAHLINFKGTDTLAAITYTYKYYNQKDMPAFSVPAAEHSTITAWGKDQEKEAYKNMLEQFPEGLVAVVSDSYDIFNAVEHIWGEDLKEQVEKRKGTVIIRPDSGEPVQVLTRILETLGLKYGYKTNDKGYKVLPSYIRLIQGDGIDEKTLTTILQGLTWKGWSIDNIAFGSGGGLLQNVNRDTLKFAYKCSNITINGQDREVSKSPITDPGKKSKAGRLALVRNVTTGKLTTISHAANNEDLLQTVFLDGHLTINQTFEEVRKRADESR